MAAMALHGLEWIYGSREKIGGSGNESGGRKVDDDAIGKVKV
jgi:hypothetical protein